MAFGAITAGPDERARWMRRLYHQTLSPFCRKIRLVLAEKKIEVELVEEKPWERRMDFLRLNPAGQVPVLKIDDLVLADSGAIFEYLEETQPDPPLLPRDPAGRAEARRSSAGRRRSGRTGGQGAFCDAGTPSG